MSRQKSNPGHSGIVIGVVLLAGALLFCACQKTDDILVPVPGDTTVLHAVYRSNEEFLSNPIFMDGKMVEVEWGGLDIPFHNIRVSSENGGGSAADPAYVSMKAIYTDRDLFLLIRWVDGGPDELKDVTVYTGPSLDELGYGCQPSLVAEENWVRNPDGRFDEDRIALAFEIGSAGNAVGSFREIGCKAACHSQESPAFGRLDYGRLDVWQWLATRTNPLRDLFDQNDNPQSPLYGLPGYLEDLQADPALGLAADPGRASYVPNFYPGMNAPRWVYRDRPPDDPYAYPRDPNDCTNLIGENCRMNNGLNFTSIWRDRLEVAVADFSACDTMFLAQPKDSRPRKWTTGDQVPGYVLTYPSGSWADVHGKANWDRPEQTSPTGVWTLELGRRLDTLDPIHDVIFQPDSSKTYSFTVAIMDNSGVEQRGSEPQLLVFDPKGTGR
jgi:hypothetical protein